MVDNVAEFAGPALATALVLGVGPGWAFAIDAGTFLVSTAFLLPLRPRERGAPAVRQTVTAELREGWAEVRSRTWVWVIIAAFSVALLTCFGPWMTLGATVAEQEYDTRAVYGILAAALGAGTVAGSLVGFRWRPRHPMRAGMLLALPWPAAIGLFALGLPVWVLVAVFVFAGGGVALFDIWWVTALAERIPPHTLSRVTAYDWMGSLALLPIGYALAGPLGEALGELEVLAGDRHRRRLHAVRGEHRGSDRRRGRAHEREVRHFAPDAAVDARGNEAPRGGDTHTSTPCSRSPSVGSSSSARFAFCTAWPAAPLPRLSIAQTTIVCRVERSSKTASSAASVTCTRASSGTTPSSSTRTTGLSSYTSASRARASASVRT
jgi:hypothetical protein